MVKHFTTHLDEPENVFIAGASSGIGEAVARQYLKRGARVAVMARRKERLEQIPGAIVCPGDITKTEDIQRALGDATMGFRTQGADHDTCDVVMNFAGGAAFMDPTSEVSLEDEEKIRKLIDLNVMGTKRLLETAISYMTDGGKVGICSSLIILNPVHGTEPYFWSKRLMESVVGSFEPQLEKRHISTTIIRPGTVNTEVWNAESKAEWHGIPDVVKIAGRMGFSPESCAKNILHDMDERAQISTPTLDSQLAHRYKEAARLIARAGSELMRRSSEYRKRR